MPDFLLLATIIATIALALNYSVPTGNTLTHKTACSH